MKKYRTILMFVLIALLVMLIGALAGWYVVLRMQGKTINFQDAARGFGLGAPSANQNGSTYENLGIGGGGGGGFNVGGGGGIGAGGSGDGSSGGGNGTGAGAGSSGNGDGSFTSANGLSGEIGTSTSGAYNSTSTLGTVIVPKTPRLWRVTKTPVAGFEFATSTSVLYFSERATGYIFRTDVLSGEILRRTNTLVPKTYEALLSRNGGAIYRSINDTTGAVQTFTGVIGSSTTANLGTLLGINLKNNIFALDANPDSKTIFYLLADGGQTIGVTMPWTEGKTGKEKQVFSSSIASWRPYALADGRLLVMEKPQDGAVGYAYEILADGSLKPLVRAAPGLTFLPIANSSTFIFGTSENGSLALYAKTSTTTYALPVKTVADKCVWAPFTPASGKKPASDLVVYCAVPSDVSSKNFLQNWYMGALHTSDSWWRLNLTTRRAEKIFSEGSANIDVVDPTIDSTGGVLAFKNGYDGALWVLRIVK